MTRSEVTELTPPMLVEPRAETVVRRALLVACVITLTLPLVLVAVDEWGDAAAALAYLGLLIVLVPLTAGLLYGALGSRRIRWLIVLAALYGLLSYLYFQGLDDPSWKEPDPEADAVAIVFGSLHLLVAACAAGLAVARLASQRR